MERRGDRNTKFFYRYTKFKELIILVTKHIYHNISYKYDYMIQHNCINDTSCLRNRSIRNFKMHSRNMRNKNKSFNFLCHLAFTFARHLFI